MCNVSRIFLICMARNQLVEKLKFMNDNDSSTNYSI